MTRDVDSDLQRFLQDFSFLPWDYSDPKIRMSPRNIHEDRIHTPFFVGDYSSKLSVSPFSESVVPDELGWDQEDSPSFLFAHFHKI